MVILDKYSVILCDPPWSYDNKRTGGSMKSGSANQYDLLTMDELKSLNIQKICKKDAVLFLWATSPLLPEAIDVMKAWGFKYKGAIYWIKKNRLGMGFWYRNQVEVLLYGTRGKIKSPRTSLSNIIETGFLKHSEKPIAAYNFIEALNLNPKIELFARNGREGWYSTGLEFDGVDIRDVI